MKKKLPILLLALVLTVSMMTSCVYIDGIGIFDQAAGSAGDTTINVTGGNSYDVDITNPVNSNVASANKALLSSVSVYTPSGSGSGVIYKLDKEHGTAYIITNFHVVYNSTYGKVNSRIEVCLYGQEAAEYVIDATYLGGSMKYDLAVLKIENSTVIMQSIAAAADFADSDKVAILDTAIAIGNAEGAGISATVGCVNVDSETITVAFTDARGTEYNVPLRVMRTDAAVNHGNSGGGLFNDKGEVIGIVNAKNVATATDNIGYAIPSNVAKAVAENILYYCNGKTVTSVYRCMLEIKVGVAALTPVYDTETGKIYKNETVIVASVDDEKSAVKGLLQKDDVINSITIDGVKYNVTRTHHVIDAMLYARVGSSVVINVTRGTQTIDVTIPITKSMLKTAEETLE